MKKNPRSNKYLIGISKSELSKRLKFRCRHRTNGIYHPNCYNLAQGVEEKIAFLDIETSNLSSDFGCILSYCLLSEKGNKFYGRVLYPQEITKGIYDKVLLKEFCQNVRKFTKVITYYGTKFDIPFLRSRCLLYHLDFPIFKELQHTDAYIIVKHKLRTLHSRRLGVVAQFYGIEAKEHPLNPTVWLACLSGNKRALNFVWTHNKEDCVSLKKLWHRIHWYSNQSKTSI